MEIDNEPIVSTDPFAPKRWPFILLGIALSLCCILVIAGVTITASLKTPCGSGDSTLVDLLRARTFGWNVFSSSEWNTSYSVQPYHINVTHLANNSGAVAFMDYLIYNCGAAETDLDTYFSEDNISSIIFQGYENVQKKTTCRSGNLRLYEYRGQFGGKNYLLSLWAKPDGSNRVIEFFTAFPANNPQLALDYANRLFPELPTCK